MDNSEWDSVLQYISDPADFASPQPEVPVSEMADVLAHPPLPTPDQVLTPPVRVSRILSRCCSWSPALAF